VAPQPAAASDDLPETQYTYIHKQSQILKAKFLADTTDDGRAEQQRKLDKYELYRSGQHAERCIKGTYLELWEEMQTDGLIFCRTVYNSCLFCLSSFLVELLCIMYFQFCVCVCVFVPGDARRLAPRGTSKVFITMAKWVGSSLLLCSTSTPVASGSEENELASIIPFGSFVM
jgi:hypothetical protein